MGKLSYGILGPLSQSVGRVTGASYKGKATLRRKSSGGVNPRTEEQQANRSVFSEASEYCRQNRDAIITQEGFKERKGVTIWNQMMSWYLAGGRLTPAGPHLQPVVIGGETYNELVGYHVSDPSNPDIVTIPLEVFSQETWTSYTLRVMKVYQGQDSTDCDYATVGVLDGENVIFTFRNLYQGLVHRLNVTGRQVVFQLELYNRTTRQKLNTMFVMTGMAGDVEYTTEVQPVSTASLAQALGVLGSVTTSAAGLVVATGESVDFVPEEDILSVSGSVYDAIYQRGTQYCTLTMCNEAGGQPSIIDGMSMAVDGNGYEITVSDTTEARKNWSRILLRYVNFAFGPGSYVEGSIMAVNFMVENSWGASVQEAVVPLKDVLDEWGFVDTLEDAVWDNGTVVLTSKAQEMPSNAQDVSWGKDPCVFAWPIRMGQSQGLTTELKSGNTVVCGFKIKATGAQDGVTLNGVVTDQGTLSQYVGYNLVAEGTGVIGGLPGGWSLQIPLKVVANVSITQA